MTSVRQFASWSKRSQARDKAYLDAVLVGPNEYDVDDIAKVIERRPWPSHVERMACSTGMPRTIPSKALHS
jgi:hypothetical protein